ncbi:GNAT family N-acetyltransferase [Streptomyces sp. NPDC060077]|uniref:GNAT family N-acetyltransferase n=1 Tax=Streptomyces sp. NPDC060077 TaxID=3347052 RepID=UPI00365FDC5B
MLPIRTATPADARALTELRRVMHDDIDGPHPTDWMQACEEMTRVRLSIDPSFHAYVVEDEGKVVAGITGEIRPRFPTPGSPQTIAGYGIAMCILPEYRRRGIGGTLVHHMTERFMTLGCARMSVFVAPMAVGLYRELGFEELDDAIKPMNRFAGRPVPPNRYTAAATAS